MQGFLGNRQTNTVHHLASMQENCKIADMELKDKQYFIPDTLENARGKNFSPCIWCLTNQEKEET